MINLRYLRCSSSLTLSVIAGLAGLSEAAMAQSVALWPATMAQVGRGEFS